MVYLSIVLVEHRKLFSFRYYVGNKAKGRFSKRVFQEKKARQIFRKVNNYPLIRIRNVCVLGGKKCLFFGKFGMLCFLESPVLRFANNRVDNIKWVSVKSSWNIMEKDGTAWILTYLCFSELDLGFLS